MKPSYSEQLETLGRHFDAITETQADAVATGVVLSVGRTGAVLSGPGRRVSAGSAAEVLNGGMLKHRG